MYVFFAPKIGILIKNSLFSYGTPRVFVALAVGFVLAPLDLLCNFLFLSYARFREGTHPTRQKVFPHPTVRTPSASNSPSALSARVGQKIYEYLYLCHYVSCGTILALPQVSRDPFPASLEAQALGL